MTIKQAFEYLASECGIGMKNPFIALRNLVEGFSKVADEIDPMPTGDFVKKSGDTMTGALVVEDDITGEDITGVDITGTRFRYVEPILGGSINLHATPSTGEVNIEIPNKSGTLTLSSSIYNYTSSEKKVGTWFGKDLYQRSYDITGGSGHSVEYDIEDYNYYDDIFIVSSYLDVQGDNGNRHYSINGNYAESSYSAYTNIRHDSGHTKAIINIGTANYWTILHAYVTIQYTKPTV